MVLKFQNLQISIISKKLLLQQGLQLLSLLVAFLMVGTALGFKTMVVLQIKRILLQLILVVQY